MEALLEEIRGRSEECKAYQVNTVFIGGGTPSVVDAKWIPRVMDTISGCYELDGNAEVTMEMNPGTVDRQKLAVYYGAGINRLSMGLQSVHNGELCDLGRIHTFEQFLEAYRMAREVGFTNINVDVMSALPGQSIESWKKTLEVLLSLEPVPEHISAYSLILEEGTPLQKRYEQGELQLPDEDSERQMYLLTEEILAKQGFHRYEISNYTRAGFECRHNCGYWKRTEYLGFGIGAASLMQESRFQNGDSLEEYMKNPLGIRGEMQKLSVEEQMEEFMFLGFRLMEGVSRQEFVRKFGTDLLTVYGSVIARNIKDGLIEEGEGDYFRLTPKGIDVSNYVMSQFLF